MENHQGRSMKQAVIDEPDRTDESTGHFTGRCRHCGSNDLWDYNLAYGCNKCGALLGTNQQHGF